MSQKANYNGRKTSLVYLERDGKYLILHRTKKEHDENGDKWIGVGTGLALASTRGYDTAGRLAWSVGEDGVRTEYRYGVSPEGGEVRTTVRAAGTDCAVTNTTVSFRDGTVKATYLNGVLKTT